MCVTVCSWPLRSLHVHDLRKVLVEAILRLQAHVELLDDISEHDRLGSHCEILQGQKTQNSIRDRLNNNYATTQGNKN